MNKKGNVTNLFSNKKTLSKSDIEPVDILKLENVNEKFMDKIQTVVEPLLNKYTEITANKVILENSDLKTLEDSIRIIQTYASIEDDLGEHTNQRNIIEKIKLRVDKLKDEIIKTSKKLTHENSHQVLMELHAECDKLLNALAGLEITLKEDAAMSGPKLN